jgi:hypothetical protein
VGHLPVAGLALILGIDRFMSEARALTNLVGNAVATMVVAKWVKELDTDVLHAELASGGRGIADEPKEDVLGHVEGQPRLTPSKPCHDEKPASAGFFARDLSTRVTVTGTLGDCP